MAVGTIMIMNFKQIMRLQKANVRTESFKSGNFFSSDHDTIDS